MRKKITHAAIYLIHLCNTPPVKQLLTVWATATEKGEAECGKYGFWAWKQINTGHRTRLWYDYRGLGLKTEQSPILKTAGSCLTKDLLERKKIRYRDRPTHTTLIQRSHKSEKGWRILRSIWTLTRMSKDAILKKGKEEEESQRWRVHLILFT